MVDSNPVTVTWLWIASIDYYATIVSSGRRHSAGRIRLADYRAAAGVRLPCRAVLAARLRPWHSCAAQNWGTVVDAEPTDFREIAVRRDLAGFCRVDALVRARARAPGDERAAPRRPPGPRCAGPLRRYTRDCVFQVALGGP